ncbi:MAG TPA: hypothetical protein VFT37_14055 [Telluria sp.]|nr:hypothetical protein [Telluria sp.]
MFGSTVLEVAIGMTFCYAFVGLLVTTVQEAIASALRLRARTLLTAIKAMFNDPNFTSLARDLYSHALVNPRDDGQAQVQSALHNKPSYISPQHFAMALVDTIQSVPNNWEQLGRDIDALGDAQVRTALQSIYLRAEGDMERFQQYLANWFDNTMERVSGAYKRRSAMFSLLISLAIAVTFNIDSIHLFSTLWQQPALAAQLKLPAATVNGDVLAALRTLPVGWADFPPRLDSAFLVQAAGWSLTAASSMFGAPFWFDLFQRLVNMRGTGSKPKESLETAAAAR